MPRRILGLQYFAARGRSLRERPSFRMAQKPQFSAYAGGRSLDCSLPPEAMSNFASTDRSRSVRRISS
jgi:hypothetical protein